MLSLIELRHFYFSVNATLVGRLYFSFADKANFYRDCLAPLFFRTLNMPRVNDIFAIELSADDSELPRKICIPYLNGGLFDQDAIEPTEIQIDPTLFESLFRFFDQYNFTIDENSPDDKDIGIDPEMLGLIFENLLEDNKDKGTFYTPKEVVHFMCKESLSQYLQGKLQGRASLSELREIDKLVKGIDSIHQATIQNFALDLNKALIDIKICDPAIGSGAFPMGMVFEILKLRKKLLGYSEKAENFNYHLEKKRIIKESIYGVDLDKGAVDIARLRFWLSLIVDEQEPQPLPNFDYKIMQGNSLLENFEGIELDGLVKDTNSPQNIQPTLGEEFDVAKEPELSYGQKFELKQAVKNYFEADNSDEKHASHKKIDKAVLKYLKDSIQDARDKIGLKYADSKRKWEKANQSGLKTQASGKLFTDIKKYETEIEEISKKEERLLKIARNEEKPYFLWHLFFGDIISEQGGFDIVIANPPYGVDVDDETQKKYGLGNKDSYGVFMALATKTLLKNNGVLCYIISDTWLTIKTHYKLRENMLNWNIRSVIRLHKDCFNATVNSCILTLIKSKVGEQNEIIAADLTNLSTRKDVHSLRDKLYALENYAGQYTLEFAVYNYHQNLLNSNSNKPIIVASPKLFALMNNTTSAARMESWNDRSEVVVRTIEINDKEIDLIRFGDIAEVKQGLATGDNDYYLYQNPNVRGNYKVINEFRQYLLTEEDLNKIRNNNEIRLKVIDLGIHKSKKDQGFDSHRYFGGRFIVPYDKGGESDSNDGWLPNYYVPTNYFIDWSSIAVNRLKSLTSKQRNLAMKKTGGDDRLCSRFQNKEFYFKSSITYSPTGIYSPTFRLDNNGLFDKEGSCIFLSNHSILFAIGILCSKLHRYFQKHVINGTVHSMPGDIVQFHFPSSKDNKVSEIENLVHNLIINQRSNLRYNYFSEEQKQIDQLVYNLYGLNAEDINEVETWFARRYPKLAQYADIKNPELLSNLSIAVETSQQRILEFIRQGESRTMEFKHTLRWDVRESKVAEHIEHSAFKNIAAFLNTDGGTLLIGVNDDGGIEGLDLDFDSFSKGNKQDEWAKHFDNLVSKYLNNAHNQLIKLNFEQIENKVIAVIQVSASPSNVLLNNKGKEEFYIRRNSSAAQLSAKEMLEWAQTKLHKV